MAQDQNALDRSFDDLLETLANTLTMLRILVDLRSAGNRLLVPFRDQLGMTKDAIDSVLRQL